jgi:hypothetical protein
VAAVGPAAPSAVAAPWAAVVAPVAAASAADVPAAEAAADNSNCSQKAALTRRLFFVFSFFYPCLDVLIENPTHRTQIFYSRVEKKGRIFSAGVIKYP